MSTCLEKSVRQDSEHALNRDLFVCSDEFLVDICNITIFLSQVDEMNDHSHDRSDSERAKDEFLR